MTRRVRAPSDPYRGARALVERLTAVAARVTPSDRRDKLRLLTRLGSTAIRDPRLLRELHEALCFLQAYPDDAEILASVETALSEFPARVKRLGSAAIRRLDGSGITGTDLRYPFALPMARWLASRFPGSIDIAWSELTDSERVEEALILLLHRAEHDAYSDEGGLGWRRWVQAAKGERGMTDLELLIELFDRAPLDPAARDQLFESLALPLRWRPGRAGASRTFAKLDWSRRFFHGDAAPTRPARRELLGEIRRPLPALHHASRQLALTLIEAARLAMATRLRELHAFSYANPADVLVADLDRGLRIALIGILPRARMPYEGYYAYLALKNGVPVGYGAAWQLVDTLELAVNVFESFRRGESAFIVGQVLRLYHHVLGMRHVVIDAYQIGRENPEALASGAFYFYYRLGFRPRDAAIRRLAADERRKITRDRRYRSAMSVLEQLAQAGMTLSLSPRPPRDTPITAARLARLVTDHIARGFGGDRRAAAQDSVTRVVRALGVRGWRAWPRAERGAFADLALLIGLIPSLERWPAVDRRSLAALMRAKGGASEARYVQLLAGHRRLYRALERLVARGALTSEERTAPTRAR